MDQFLNNIVSDLAMISKLADAKGKIATFSEFGYSPQGIKVEPTSGTEIAGVYQNRVELLNE